MFFKGGRVPSGSALRYPRLMSSLPDYLKPLPAGRRKLEREVLEEHQRARILEAAIGVFAAKGYPAATVDDVVAAARIGVGSFYAHFGGKEQCLVGAYDQVAAEAREVVLEAAAGAEGWAAEACLGLRALLGYIAAEPERANVALVQVQTGGPAALERYDATIAALCAFLRRGRERLEQPERLADSLEQSTANGIAWLLHHRVSAGEAGSIGELFDDLAQMILEPYLGEGGAKRAIAARAPAPSAA